MKASIISNHVYSLEGRKASIHFLTDQLAARGYDVTFLTVGASWITAFKRGGRYETLRDVPKNVWLDPAPSIRSFVLRSALSPANMRVRWLNILTEPVAARFGRRLPSRALDAIRSSDLVIIDSGSAVCFYPLARATAPRARVIYNCADLLSSIGVRETVLAAERRVLAEADLIRLTSSRMRDMIGAPARSVVSFHGVDKDLFDRCETSPYEHGSTNFISVGNMLFDQAAVAEIARVDSRIRIHVFGAKWEGARPENVTDYGERPFTAIVPYIKFADGGIAPYRLRPEHHYLVQSSLKVLQYTYCALPIIAPNSVDWGRKHVITYDPNDVSSFGRAVAAVRSFPRMTIDASGIRTWSQTLEDMLMSLDPARESLRYG